MPFDSANFHERRPRRRRVGSEDLLLWLVGLLALAMLLLPISITGLADLVRYVQAP